jgi:hypothetical protein
VKGAITLKQDEKAKQERLVKNFIGKTAKLKEKLSRIVVSAG